MNRRHHDWVIRLRVYGWAWLPIALAFFAWHTWRGTAGRDDLVTPGADFINFWSAARLGLQGHIADVYDFARFYHFETATIGRPIVLHYYSYPPVTILMTLPWGLLPYITGLVAWLAGGCIAFMLLVRAAWPGRRSFPDVVLYSIAVPAVLMNLLAGQNGTWTAVLLGGGLMALERRPVLAGMLLAGLVAKPQMALLVPFALLAARRWTTLMTCAITAAALIGASVLLFGMDPWIAFAHRIPVLRQWDLEDGTGVWHFYACIFVSVRHLPASLLAAYATQGIVTVVVLLLVICVWHSSAPLAVKNAVLVASTPFASPYFQVYDLVVLSLVPLWLLSTERANFSAILWSAVPLTVVPLVAPIVALEANVDIAPLALLPALMIAVGHYRGEQSAPAIVSTISGKVVAALVAPGQARGQT